MPSVRQVKLQNGSIETTLARSKRHLLPEALLEDPLASWILDFDRPSSDRPSERGRLQGRGRMPEVIVKKISERVVQPTLSFYHAALMHFGFQWAAAEEGIERARALLSSDNLERSAKDVEARLVRSSIGQGDGRDLVARFADQLSEAWGERKNLVARAWGTWREEVGELQSAMSRVEHALSDPSERFPIDIFDLLQHCLKPSQLSEHGFPDRREMSLDQTVSILAMAGVFYLSGDRSRYGEHRYYEFEHFLNRLADVDAKRAQIPIVIEEIRALEAEYAGFNPFEPYYGERAPADGALQRLVVHNRYHSGEPSRWLREFEATLRTVWAWPPPSALLTEDGELSQLVEWGAITADAEIKKHVVGNRQAFRPESAQIAFEREWVVGLARHLFKEGTQPSFSTTSRFYNLARSVAITLGERGNATVAPSEERLRALVDQIVQDGYFYGEW